MDVFEKSETVDPEVRAYIYSLVNAIGGQSTLDDRYALGDDALAVLNDLLRWLRLYDEKTNRFDVKRCLADANLVKGDLLEILALWPEEAQENNFKAKLALACLQLLVPLTWPIALEEDKTTRNHLRHAPYLQLAQVGYKRAILHYDDAAILRTAIRVGLPAMATARRDRSKRDEGIIKMVLYLLRNVAMITQPQHLPSQGDENEIGRSATIDVFQEQDVFSLLLTVGSGCADEFQEQDVIVLETLSHVLKGVDPKKLFIRKEQLANEETDELRDLIRRERAMLGSFNKHAPTRHNRFGTMLWVRRDDKKMSTVTGQNSITNDSATLQQMDASKKWNKPRYRGKVALETDESSDFGAVIDLTERARNRLRSFVEDFLDSSFNPLFASLRKAIERESSRIGNENVRQYFYLISWFLAAETARRDSATHEGGSHVNQSPADSAGDNTFTYIAAVLDQETFVLLNRRMERAIDEKNWQELRATLLCFTQILLMVQMMSESKTEEDQEIAENIQNRIFYEESTHERIVQVLRGYTTQGFAYLDAVTECVHVFVRMLEQYSKQNVDLQVRSKRRARRKKKKKQQASQDGESGLQGPHNNADDENDGNAAEDVHEAQLTVTERKFDFARFSAKFLSQPCVNTFIALLHFYADLTPAQLKRCHRYLYRLAFKQGQIVLLYRVDILALLHKITKGPNGLSPETEGFKEWETLVQQIFRRCIKWLEREGKGQGWKEAAMVEMLFSKIPQTLFYLQNNYDRVVERRAPRPPAELVLKAEVKEENRVGVLVSVMLELGKQDDVEWIKKELQNAMIERQAWEDERLAKASFEVEAESDAVPSSPSVLVIPDTDARKASLFKDKHLRLFLTTVGLHRLGTADDVDASWVIPAGTSVESMASTLQQIVKAEFDPPTFEDGKTAQELIRNKSAAAKRNATFSDSQTSGDEDNNNDNEPLFPPNIPHKRPHPTDDDRPSQKRRLHRRNRAELSDAQAQQKADERAKKERERNLKIKSALFVTSSDDESDEEKNAEFFRMEKKRRERTKGEIERSLTVERERGGMNRRKKVRRGKVVVKKNKKGGEESGDVEDVHQWAADTDEEDATHSDLDVGSGRKERNSHDSMEDADTPSTSPTAPEEAVEPLPLSELAANTVANKRTTAQDEYADDDEEDGPVVKPSTRRRVRAGFVIDDSSDED